MRPQFNILLALFLLSNGILIYLLFAKRTIAPPVYVVFNGKNSGYTEIQNAGSANFWDNYPYAVASSDKATIDSNITISNKDDMSIRNFSNKLIFRYFASKADDNFIWKELKKTDSLIVVVDSSSLEKFLSRKETFQISCEYLLLKQKSLKLPCDEINKSYFFVISRAGKIRDIYYPRIEVPEVLERYVAYERKRAKTL